MNRENTAACPACEAGDHDEQAWIWARDWARDYKCACPCHTRPAALPADKQKLIWEALNAKFPPVRRAA